MREVKCHKSKFIATLREELGRGLYLAKAEKTWDNDTITLWLADKPIHVEETSRVDNWENAFISCGGADDVA